MTTVTVTSTAPSNTIATKGEAAAAAAAEFIPRGDVVAELNFYSPPADGSAPQNIIPPADSDATFSKNYGTTAVAVTVRDLRGNEHGLSLDREAFALHTIPTSLSYEDFADDEKITSVYYPEVEAIVKSKVANAKEVVIFDHTVRRSELGAARGPVALTHIDQTQRSGTLRLEKHLSAERFREVKEKGLRYQIINVWRPINGPVVANPLAFADSSSVPDEDLVPVAHVYTTGYRGETAAVNHNPAQKWWYVSGQTPDEVTLIKCFDSEKGPEGYRRVPHTAFAHPGTVEGARGRESIEIRCLIVDRD